MSKSFIIPDFILIKEIFFTSIKGLFKVKINFLFCFSFFWSSIILVFSSIFIFSFSFWLLLFSVSSSVLIFVFVEYVFSIVVFSILGDEIEIFLESIYGFVTLNLFSILFSLLLLLFPIITSFWVVITWFIWLLLLSGNKFILFCCWLIFWTSFWVVVVMTWVTVVVVTVVVCVTCWLLIVWIFLLLLGKLIKLCSLLILCGIFIILIVTFSISSPLFSFIPAIDFDFLFTIKPGLYSVFDLSASSSILVIILVGVLELFLTKSFFGGKIIFCLKFLYNSQNFSLFSLFSSLLSSSSFKFSSLVSGISPNCKGADVSSFKASYSSSLSFSLLFISSSLLFSTSSLLSLLTSIFSSYS